MAKKGLPEMGRRCNMTQSGSFICIVAYVEFKCA